MDGYIIYYVYNFGTKIVKELQWDEANYLWIYIPILLDWYFELWYSKDWIYWMTWYCVLLTWYKKKEKSHMVNIKYDSIHGDLAWFIIDGDVMITKLPWNWMYYRLTTKYILGITMIYNKERETIWYGCTFVTSNKERWKFNMPVLINEHCD